MSSKKSEADQGKVVKDLVVSNKLGLHARPAASFVRIASKYKADIYVEKDGEEINGKSIMGLMLLAAGCGSSLKVTAVGQDAAEAVKEIEKLVVRKFDED